MFSVSKVLCPIDFSPATDRALDAGAQIARQFGADLYLLHVVERPGVERFFETAATRDVREAVRTRLDGLAGAAGGVRKVHVLVAEGSPAVEIRRVEEMFGIDLIVLPPHGRTTVGRIIFGSVAEAIIRAAEAAVLIVKPIGHDDGPD